MAEDVNGLADDEESGDAAKGKKKPPKEKKEKAPKPAPPAPAPAAGALHGKADHGKKKGGNTLILLIVVLVLIVLIAALCVAIYLNWFGLGDMVLTPLSEWLISVVIWLDPGFTSVEAHLWMLFHEMDDELEGRMREIETREAEVAAREAGANAREVQLNRRSDALNRREDALDQREDVETPMFRRVLTEQELADLQSLSRMYTQMPPDTAAELLAGLYNNMDIASILYYMTERNAATILAAMDTELAVAITRILLNS